MPIHSSLPRLPKSSAPERDLFSQVGAFCVCYHFVSTNRLFAYEFKVSSKILSWDPEISFPGVDLNKGLTAETSSLVL